MKAKLWMTLGTFALALSTTPVTLAQCGMPAKGVKTMAWHPQGGAVHLVQTADEDTSQHEKTMVGMWHVIFTANTSGPAAIPPTVIDNALAVWHSDHTEIMNSVRPAQDGNFCLGVWERLDTTHYFLNHFPWYANEFPNSNASGIGDPQGPTRIREWVTLGEDGDHFTGTFALFSYDLSNKVLASFTGTLSGTRITTKTTEKELVN